jgi:beta-phosphoglucomutase
MTLPGALLFDFDGVIVDSEPMHERGLRVGVAKLGMKYPDPTPTLNLVGLADRDAYRIICGLHDREPSDAEFAELSREKWVYAQQSFLTDGAPVFPGTLALMRAGAAAGVPMGICSGARRNEIEHVVKALGIGGMLGFIISADDVRRSKPDPEPYLKAVGKVGVDPSRCVTIEDTDKGIASAKSAGIRVVAVGHTMSRDRLTAADRFVQSVDELSLSDLGVLTQS